MDLKDTNFVDTDIGLVITGVLPTYELDRLDLTTSFATFNPVDPRMPSDSTYTAATLHNKLLGFAGYYSFAGRFYIDDLHILRDTIQVPGLAAVTRSALLEDLEDRTEEDFAHDEISISVPSYFGPTSRLHTSLLARGYSIESVNITETRYVKHLPSKEKFQPVGAVREVLHRLFGLDEETIVARTARRNGLEGSTTQDLLTLQTLLASFP